MDENKTDENDDLRINEETIIERNHSTPRNKGRFFIIFLIGIVIGLVVMIQMMTIREYMNILYLIMIKHFV